MYQWSIFKISTLDDNIIVMYSNFGEFNLDWVFDI